MEYHFTSLAMHLRCKILEKKYIYPGENPTPTVIPSPSPHHYIDHLHYTITTSVLITTTAIISTNQCHLTTSICPTGQGSLTGKAIKDSWNQMFSAVPRGRKSKLVLLTDGPSNDDVKVPSKWIRDNGVELFVIGLGKGYDETQLRDMASLPSDKHIMFKDYDGLSASVQEVRNRVCGFNAKEGWSSLENYWTQNCNCHVQFSLSIKSFKSSEIQAVMSRQSTIPLSN